jgi:hypothetical protein
MTLEAIAKADGTVSRKTIERAPVWTNDQTEIPAKVTGKDGKTYPTKKPRKPKQVVPYKPQYRHDMARPMALPISLCHRRLGHNIGTKI